MLTVLATLSIPLAKDVAEQTIDTGIAVTLASSAQRVAQAAEEVSYSGCGSFKNVTVYLDPDPFAATTLYVNKTGVWGEYFDLVNDKQKTKLIPYAKYIKMTAYCGDYGNTFVVKVEKDCSTDRIDPLQDEGVADNGKAHIGDACL